MLRPYKRSKRSNRSDRQDAVQMVGHKNEFAEVDSRKMLRNAYPAFQSDLTQRAWCETPLYDVSEKTASLMSANGDQIRTGKGIVPIFQPNRAAVPSSKLAPVLLHATKYTI